MQHTAATKFKPGETSSLVSQDVQVSASEICHFVVSVVFRHCCLLPVNSVSTVHLMSMVEIHKTLKYIFLYEMCKTKYTVQKYYYIVFNMKLRINSPYIKLLLFFLLQ